MHTGDYMTFGMRLKKCRKAKGLTQKELAALIGASYASISNWEKDQNVPDGNKILLLIKALDVQPEELVGRYDLNQLADIEDKDSRDNATLTTDERAALEYARAVSSDVWKDTIVPLRSVVTSVGEVFDDVTREIIDVTKDMAAEQKRIILDLVKAMRGGGKGD